MDGKINSRRNFIGRSFRGAVLSAMMPGFFSETILTCNHSRTEPNHLKDDLKELKAAISDKQKPLKWLFTGDSITQGAKHTMGYRSYPEIFSEHVRFEMGRSRDIVINTAISGHTTQEILGDYDWRIGQFTPNVVSLMIGTNDAARSRHISVDDFGKNLKLFIQKIRTIPAIPVLQTPNVIRLGDDPENNERSGLSNYVAIIREVAAKNNVILIDHWKYWEENMGKTSKTNWLNDPLHPNGEGHLEMARLLFSKLDICDNHSFTCTGTVHF